MLPTPAKLEQAISLEAESWANVFNIDNPHALEARKQVMRANVACGYLEPLKPFLGATVAYDVVIRRIATGADFTMRLFAVDSDAACKAAKDRARFACGMRKMDLHRLEVTQGIAVFRVVNCEVSADQSRPVAA